eukprot:Tbor_TRINITY_DN4944_c0_g1::TRINITY_DN4944_c0_g1_i1::g.9857::m.9857
MSLPKKPAVVSSTANLSSSCIGHAKVTFLSLKMVPLSKSIPKMRVPILNPKITVKAFAGEAVYRLLKSIKMTRGESAVPPTVTVKAVLIGQDTAVFPGDLLLHVVNLRHDEVSIVVDCSAQFCKGDADKGISGMASVLTETNISIGANAASLDRRDVFRIDTANVSGSPCPITRLQDTITHSPKATMHNGVPGYSPLSKHGITTHESPNPQIKNSQIALEAPPVHSKDINKPNNKTATIEVITCAVTNTALGDVCQAPSSGGAGQKYEAKINYPPTVPASNATIGYRNSNKLDIMLHRSDRTILAEDESQGLISCEGKGHQQQQHGQKSVGDNINPLIGDESPMPRPPSQYISLHNDNTTVQTMGANFPQNTTVDNNTDTSIKYTNIAADLIHEGKWKKNKEITKYGTIDPFQKCVSVEREGYSDLPCEVVMPVPQVRKSVGSEKKNKRSSQREEMVGPKTEKEASSVGNNNNNVSPVSKKRNKKRHAESIVPSTTTSAKKSKKSQLNKKNIGIFSPVVAAKEPTEISTPEREAVYKEHNLQGWGTAALKYFDTSYCNPAQLIRQMNKEKKKKLAEKQQQAANNNTLSSGSVVFPHNETMSSLSKVNGISECESYTHQDNQVVHNTQTCKRLRTEEATVGKVVIPSWCSSEKLPQQTPYTANDKTVDNKMFRFPCISRSLFDNDFKELDNDNKENGNMEKSEYICKYPNNLSHEFNGEEVNCNRNRDDESSDILLLDEDSNKYEAAPNGWGVEATKYFDPVTFCNDPKKAVIPDELLRQPIRARLRRR